jgi:hypothetical protein
MARAVAGSMMGQAQPQAPNPSVSGSEHDRTKLRTRHSRQVGRVESPTLDHLRYVHLLSPVIAARPRNYPVNSVRVEICAREPCSEGAARALDHCCAASCLLWDLICQNGPAVPRHAALLAAARRDGSFALEAACAARPCGPRSLSGICGRYPPPDALHLYPTAVPTRTEQISWRFR